METELLTREDLPKTTDLWEARGKILDAFRLMHEALLPIAVLAPCDDDSQSSFTIKRTVKGDVLTVSFKPGLSSQ
jgi:hypothetical protein